MPLNSFFTNGTTGEQQLVEDLVVEQIKMFGVELFYIPKTLVSEDNILGEDSLNSFNSAYQIEGYLENVQGFGGDGDLFSKFGVRIADQVNFIIARKRFKDLVDDNTTLVVEGRPNEGDLIYFPLAKKLFQIQYVEYEQPFYQLNKIHIWGLKCELFEYSGEDLDTGVEDIDVIERNLATTITVNFAAGGTGTFTVGEVVAGGTSNVTAEVKSWNATDRQLQVYNRSGIFTIPETVTGQTSGAAWTSASYNTLNNVNTADSVDTNFGFETADDDIIDFTEGNPFGSVGSTTDTTI